MNGSVITNYQTITLTFILFAIQPQLSLSLPKSAARPKRKDVGGSSSKFRRPTRPATDVADDDDGAPGAAWLAHAVMPSPHAATAKKPKVTERSRTAALVSLR